MATFYALRLGNGAWLDQGGAQQPTKKISSDLQHAKIYNSISAAKMQQTEFIKNRNRFPDNKDFQQKCEVIQLDVTDGSVAVRDSMGKEVTTAKKFNPNIDTEPREEEPRPEPQDTGDEVQNDRGGDGSLSNIIRKGINRAGQNRNQR